MGIYQAQADCGPGATAKNMARMEEAVETAKKYDVQLLSFPELYAPGYAQGPEEAKQVSEYKDGPSITRAREIAKKNNMALILPFAEKVDAPGGARKYFDSISVISEDGRLLDSYRKTHLYGLQERDNWSFGMSDYPVHAVFGFPVGVLNCYECEFPELQRILALKGAKLIVGPTAADRYCRLPDGSRSKAPYPDIARTLIPSAAYVNNLFYAYSNRTGYEHIGKDLWHYRGNSIVCGPHGDILVEANNEQDTLMIADYVPAYYRMTHPAPKYHYLKDRRPQLYQQLYSGKARFVDFSEHPVDLNTDLPRGGFTYPSYEED